MTLTGVISYPVPAYANVPIEPQFYQPSRFVISGLILGITTVVTTSQNHNYVIGQLVRLLIPTLFGSYQLNEIQGYVIAIPTLSSVEVTINSVDANAFIASPYTATITNITQAATATVTANNSFLRGNVIVFSDVAGMTQINTLVAPILSVSPTSFVMNLDTTSFSAYGSGGIASLYNVPQTYAQIVAVGDVNSGIISSTGRIIPSTNVPGSFINISP